MIYSPIWKDTFYESTENTLIYKIKVGVEIIFVGKAYKYPNATTLKINMSNICRDYLWNDFDEAIKNMLDGKRVPFINCPNAVKTFTLCDHLDNVLEEYTFLFDWSYEGDFTGESMVMSRPINGHYAANMLRPYTQYNKSTGTVRLYPNDLSIDKQYPTLIKECKPYVLYYLNANGAFDAFVIEGAVNKTDNISQFTTEQSFDNKTFEFETNRYISEIQRTYEMTTGFLTDEQSERLATHLIPSNVVYLHNTDENWVHPVIITDTSVKHQTYQNNGKKLCQYKINIKESQTKVRR